MLVTTAGNVVQLLFAGRGSHSHVVGQLVLLLPFYRGRNRALEQLSGLPKVIHC